MANKKLKVGKVPNLRFSEFTEEWKTKKLGEIGDVKMCRRIFNDETEPMGDIPFFKIGSFGKEADAFISKELYLDYRKRFSFPKKGDILISAAGTIGRTVVYDGNDAYFQDSNIVWIDNDNKNITNEFLYYILQIVKYNTEGGTIQRLYNNVLKSTKFSSPSIQEQEKISSFLSLLDERIHTQNKIIKELNVLKTTLTKRIFSQELRFKDENGNEFSSWERFTLGEIGEFSGGGTPTSYNDDFWNGHIPWISSSDLSENNIHSINIARFITQNAVNSSATKLCVAPLVLIVSRVGVGKVAYSEKSLCTSQDFLIMHNFSCNGLFLTYLLSIEMKKAASNSQGTSIKGISSSEIKSKQILLPCKAEQIKIANFLSSIDSKIDTETQILNKLEEQKKFLLQQMFV